eukprot:6559887-Pyramimonas_sp.AAC.1
MSRRLSRLPRAWISARRRSRGQSITSGNFQCHLSRLKRSVAGCRSDVGADNCVGVLISPSE